MRKLRFSHGYLHWNPVYGTTILVISESNMWETGSYKHMNIGIGSMAFEVGNPITRPCFATEILESGRPTSGKNQYPYQINVLLRICDVSSLVVDRLCDWATGRNAAVACFYFDFAAQKEQTPRSFLSSLLRQVVGGLEKIPEGIVQAFRDREKVIGGKKLRLDELVEMLQDIASSRPTFICIDALDECKPEYRAKLLDSLRQVLHKSTTTRIFLAGRLHIRDEVEKHLAGRVVAVSVIPTREDIIRFLLAKLGEDTSPDAMDRSLKEDILTAIPETVSEM